MRGVPYQGGETIRRAVFLSWHDHPRSRSLASKLGVPFHAYVRRRSGVLRHLEGTAWTLGRLWRLRPTVIFLQNSYLLLLVCIVYKSIRPAWRTVVVVDAHNKSLKRTLKGPLASLFWRAKAWSFQKSDLVVVSNALLVPFAQMLSPHVGVVRDPLPQLTLTTRRERADKRLHVLFVCSFEADEPRHLIWETALRLEGTTSLNIVITGTIASKDIPGPVRRSRRIFMPGFVSRHEYARLLFSAAVVVVLTADADCLPCGAYEAIAARRPIVLSDTALLRDTFGDGPHFVTHDPSATAAAIVRAAREPREERLQHTRARLVSEFEREWREFNRELERLERKTRISIRREDG
jgi:glycosyltransferase involved in cell wall biosynthesis